MKHTVLRTATTLLLLLPLAACVTRKSVQDGAPAAAIEVSADASADSIAQANARRLEAERAHAIASREAARAEAERTIERTIYFEYDEHALGERAEQEIQAVADALRTWTEVRVRIEGHADLRGSSEYNLALGQRRADQVRSALLRWGTEPDRIATLSYGKEAPAVEGEDEAAHRQNRRAVLRIEGR